MAREQRTNAVATHAKLMKVCPSLCGLAAHIGDPAVRHRGTIGGSIANNDPAADYPAAMIALDATIVTNKRKIKAERFFTSMFETALKDDELVKGGFLQGRQNRVLMPNFPIRLHAMRWPAFMSLTTVRERFVLA